MSARSFRRANARRSEQEQRRLARLKRRALVAGATLGASAALAGSAQAATTYTVDTTADDAGNVPCVANHCPTLRDALAAVSDGDTIDLSGLSGDIQLTNGALSVGYAIAINGPGAGTLSVTGDSNFDDRVFYVHDAAGSAGVSISGLTIEHGYQDGEGGAIMNENNAPLTLTNDVVKDSAANFDGGGIYSNGALNLSGTTVTNNTSHDSGIARGGGGIASDAAMTISGSHIDGNHADSGFGGGIIVEEGGSLTLSSSTVSGNDAQSGAGGIEAKYGGVSTGDGTTIADNTSTRGGGLLIGSTFGVSTVASPSRASGPASDPPVTIDKTTISGNHAELGAGIDVAYTSSGMPITLSSSTLSGNQADQGTATKTGGGLEIEGPVDASIEVIDSTLSGNTADVGGGVGVGNPNGSSSTGPIDTANGGSLTFDNTTVDSNSASHQDGGGGIYLANYYPNVDQPQTATVALNSTVVAGNSASGSGNDLSRGGDSSSVPGGFNANYSLIQNPDSNTLLPGGQSDITGIDAQLGPLANNGGPTQTMLPANSSPVIDQGKAASGLTSDQRGEPRTVDLGKPKPPGGDATDIGSVEVQKAPSPPPKNPQISAVVDPATGITMVHATLNGKVNTSGLAVKWHFQWGRTTSYGNVTPDRSISAGHGTVPVSFQISGLKPGTVYHYRVVAVSSAGQTATSSDAQFKTPAPTINVHPGAQYQGKKVRVFGRAGGCPTGDRVTLISRAFSHAHDFAGQPAIYAKVLPGDRYSTITRIPAHKTPARYAITGRCGGGNFGVTAHLRVLKKKVRAVHIIRFTG